MRIHLMDDAGNLILDAQYGAGTRFCQDIRQALLDQTRRLHGNTYAADGHYGYTTYQLFYALSEEKKRVRAKRLARRGL